MRKMDLDIIARSKVSSRELPCGKSLFVLHNDDAPSVFSNSIKAIDSPFAEIRRPFTTRIGVGTYEFKGKETGSFFRSPHDLL